MHIRIRGVLARGFGGPCIQGPFMECGICNDVVPIHSWAILPWESQRVPFYGSCVNGHSAIEQLHALVEEDEIV